MRYTETRPAAWNAKARLQDMDQDHIDLAVLYPTMLLGLQSEPDVDFAEAQARAYNDWCSDHVQEGEGRLFGAGAVPPMHDPDDVARVAAEIRRVAELARHGVGLHAAQPGGGLAAVQRSGLRPDLAGGVGHRAAHRPAPLPLARSARGLHRASRLGRPRNPDGSYVDDFDPNRIIDTSEQLAHPEQRPSVLFTQAIANPVDVMSCIAYLLAGGVCERFPDAKFIFLEANGGWLVPWLERLDHHCRKFQWEVPTCRCCPRSTCAGSAGSASIRTRPCCAPRPSRPWSEPTGSSGRSDYPHPDAKFPGVTEELTEALDGLTFEQKRQITSESAVALYSLN